MNPQEPLLMTVRALMQVLDASDPATRGHSLRVSRYALRVARELGVPAAEFSAIELGSLLHDIGRSAALHDVLHQPRPLDAGERAVIQTHPSIGWEILKDIPGMKDAAEIVLSHHERPDGRGYPRQLSGGQVPVGARIVMVCAAFEAMTEERPYRRGLPPATACEELRRHAGTQFYPEVVEAFVRLHDRGSLWEDFSPEELDLYVSRRGQAAA